MIDMPPHSRVGSSSGPSANILQVSLMHSGVVKVADELVNALLDCSAKIKTAHEMALLHGDGELVAAIAAFGWNCASLLAMCASRTIVVDETEAH